jgi:hypothetical protein
VQRSKQEIEGKIEAKPKVGCAQIEGFASQLMRSKHLSLAYLKRIKKRASKR